MVPVLAVFGIGSVRIPGTQRPPLLANEGVWPSEARARGTREYQPWHGCKSGPKGTITDDTQMTMWLAESILAPARRAPEAGTPGLRDHLLDPDDLARRFSRERIRGIGQATAQFIDNVKAADKPWYEVGVPSAGNGTAMRAAPVGVVHVSDPYRSTGTRSSNPSSPIGTPRRSRLLPVRRTRWLALLRLFLAPSLPWKAAWSCARLS